MEVLEGKVRIDKGRIEEEVYRAQGDGPTAESGRSRKCDGVRAHGPDGRFLPRTYIVIDDFGNAGPYHPKERCFGYAVTIAEGRTALENLAKENRRIHGTRKEVKAAQDTPWHKMRMAFGIRRLGVYTGAEYVDKRRPPNGWDSDPDEWESNKQRSKRRAKNRMKVLNRVIDRALEETDSKDVFVIVDYHNQHSNVGGLCRSKSTKGRIVDGGQYSSARSEYSDMLQAHDYVTNAAGSATKGFPIRARCMRMRIRRIRKYERI